MQSALDHLTAQVRAAYADHTPLWVQGGGSKHFHVPALPGAQVLDVTPWQDIVSYVPSELVVTVRTGTPLAQLQSALVAQGQCLPFEPPHFAAAQGRNATVGGMVAAGWSGPARASVGSVRDYVLGVEMLNGRGELLRFGGQVMKNVAGYDVSRLMVGSWGCLGVLTEVSLKVLPIPAGDATLCLPCTQAEALQRVHAWRSQPLPLHASAWVPAQDAVGEDAAQAGDAGHFGHLYVRWRGAAAAVQAVCRSVGGQPLEAVQAAQWWASCRDQQLPWFAAPQGVSAALWRLSVPAVAPLMPAWDGVGAPLLEWHGAQRWVWAPLAQGPQLQRWAQQVGGRAVLFRVPEGQCTTALAQFGGGDAVLQALQQRVKQAFDPAGILNPGWVPAATPAASV